MTTNLRDARRRAGFRSQDALADKLDLHLNTVGRWERGEIPTPKWLEDYLEMTINNNSLPVTCKVIIRFDDVAKPVTALRRTKLSGQPYWEVPNDELVRALKETGRKDIHYANGALDKVEGHEDWYFLGGRAVAVEEGWS